MSINRRISKGFSLLEVVIALTILTMLSGGIYSVLRGTIEVATNLRENQIRQQQIDSFLELCRHTFRILPAEAQLESRIQMQGRQPASEITFRNAPQLFAWGNIDDLQTVSVLGLKPTLGGGFSLALLRLHISSSDLPTPAANAKPGDWLELIPGVRSLSWRFFDRNSTAWTEILLPGSSRPAAAELTLILADQPEPIRAVFEIIPSVNDSGLSFASFAQTKGNDSRGGSHKTNLSESGNSAFSSSSAGGIPTPSSQTQRKSNVPPPGVSQIQPNGQSGPSFINWDLSPRAK